MLMICPQIHVCKTVLVSQYSVSRLIVVSSQFVDWVYSATPASMDNSMLTKIYNNTRRIDTLLGNE